MKKLIAGLFAMFFLWEARGDTIAVTNTLGAGAGSLDQALTDVMKTPAPRNVHFNIGPSGTVQTIAMTGLFPELTNAVTIDGSTQPGTSNTPLIRVVNGGAVSDCFRMYGGSNHVRQLEVSGYINVGLTIAGFGGSSIEGCVIVSNGIGIQLNDSANNVIGGDTVADRNIIGRANTGVELLNAASAGNYIAGNYIGVDASGSGMSLSNRQYGVRIQDGVSNIVRGSATARQIISANGTIGVYVTGAAARGNRIEGNYIGLDASGLVALTNGAGVEIAAPENVVGGFNPSNRNYIAGNTSAGVRLITGFAWGNQVVGNFLGLDAVTATAGIRYSGAGIQLSGAASNNIVRGTGSSPQVISGHGGAGVWIQGPNANGNVVAGNVIGLNVASGIVSNDTGISISDGSGNIIGGTNVADRNYICGSRLSGISIGSSGNSVAGNYIGVDPAGLRKANGTRGIEIDDAANTLIGGSTTNARNIISGNQQEGIFLGGSASTGARIEGNWIGVGPIGTVVSNNGNGITIGLAPGVVIGGTNAGQLNVISGNGGDGIHINPGATGTGTVIRGNFIGTVPSGFSAVPNSGDGIDLEAAKCEIGGAESGARNVISGNRGPALRATSSASNLVIRGNYIGVGSDGVTSIPNVSGGSSEASVIISSPNNQIGGLTTSERNIICGGYGGLNISANLAVNNTVQGNYFGVTSDDVSTVTNTSYGILISTGASNNLVGGLTLAARNVICGGGSHGIRIDGANTAGNLVQGNYLGLLPDVSAPAASQGSGITISQQALRNVVGGTADSARNIISGNDYGVSLDNAGVLNLIDGNYIGTSANGMSVVSNSIFGIHVLNSRGALIQNNLISGNGVSSPNSGGIYLSGTNNVGCVIRANQIGTDATGLGPLPNRQVGILVSITTNILIGGTNIADRNVIAFNTGKGVTIVSNAGNFGHAIMILGNLIYSNASGSIDLGDNGLNGNDPAPDADNGPNRYQNYPSVTNAVVGTTLQGSLVSAPSTTYLLEFFAAPAANQSRVFLGRTNLTLDASGTQAFTVAFASAAPTGWLVSATATDPSGNTSELAVPAPTGLKAALDGDGDGMWDAWETANFGNTTNFGNIDNDGDGRNNYYEFVSDTSPTNGNSYFRLVMITNSLPHHPGWNSSAARWYDMEYSTNILSPTWTGIATNLIGSGGVQTFADAADRTQRFYRVRVKIP